MRIYWLQYQVNMNNCNIYWGAGKDNQEDYFTKHHPASHHKHMRNQYLLSVIQINTTDLLGCDKAQFYLHNPDLILQLNDQDISHLGYVPAAA